MVPEDGIEDGEKFSGDGDDGNDFGLACLNELVANAMLYGYPEGQQGRIEVVVETEASALRVTIEDDGIAFDPLAAPEAQPMSGLDDARIGGFGIKLFRESSHSARYERSEGRNRLTFRCG